MDTKSTWPFCIKSGRLCLCRASSRHLIAFLQMSRNPFEPASHQTRVRPSPSWCPDSGSVLGVPAILHAAGRRRRVHEGAWRDKHPRWFRQHQPGMDLCSWRPLPSWAVRNEEKPHKVDGFRKYIVQNPFSFPAFKLSYTVSRGILPFF